ncbi:4'-phosphopantetheine phosphatase-like [Antedon mediterranea]|uniref:4'-phosphopantetheine phosphatase-like n=1 Tax=Antedon mediterranea TaxID=105859 RepID=UPI003AF69461
MSEPSSYAQCITLPPDQVFRNLKNAKRFAIDIGGSLCKLAYYSTLPTKQSHCSEAKEQCKDGKESPPLYEVGEKEEISTRLHFIKFETKYIESCLDFVKQNLIENEEQMNGKIVKATGGGAYKYKELLSEKLAVTIEKEDEMDCLIKGLHFLLRNIPDEAFIFQRHANQKYQFQPSDQNIFPYLLVNIGSGVSIVKVESETQYERIGGSAMGGGTFWGLGSLLTKAKGFDELLKLAMAGDHRNVDMLVKDIYGGAYSAMGLPEDLLACHFGRTVKHSMDDQSNSENEEYAPEDIAKSLLLMISNGIGQMTCLYANLENMKRVYFGGYFIRGHPVIMAAITFALNYFSKGEVQALYLRHEGYLGAIGAFLKGAEEDDTDKYQWGENFAGSSGFSSPTPYVDFSETGISSSFDLFEMNRLDRVYVPCPRLKCPVSYVADLVDLTNDSDARDYWLKCFEEALTRVGDYAVKSQSSTQDAMNRAEQFKEKYRKRLRILQDQPFAFGSLTVRSLLETREQCLYEFSFPDPYCHLKREENEAALKFLPSRLNQLDSMAWLGRQMALIEGVLAGNVFDWGSKAVTTLLEKGNFGFMEAKSSLQPRPWLVDNLDAWLERLKGPPHKRVVIFVDNSGADIILGIFPLVREFLKRGTQVILSANSKPALNDITHNELVIIVERIITMDETIKTALYEKQLQLIQNGSGSPCLDLSRIDQTIASCCNEADLIILEGMGRAIHTNYSARFSCESLKLAVLKNKWLAERFGGGMFSIVVKYEM